MLLSLHAPVTLAVQQRAVSEVQLCLQTSDPAVTIQGKEASLSKGTVFQGPVGGIAGRVREAQLLGLDAVASGQSQQVSWSRREKIVRVASQ